MISLYLVIYDVIAVNAAYFLGLWFRFDCTYSAIPGEYLSAYLKFTSWYTVFSVFVFWMLRLYNSVWRFASYSELIRVGISTVITFLFQAVGIGAWEYDIIGPWYKCNMTDIMAAIGLRQLDRYPELLKKRRQIVEKYDAMCDELGVKHLMHKGENYQSSNHLSWKKQLCN